ncbi:MAG: hypothetical protein HY293_07070 [Planctomycetes bacterium]|nr:hypothetical protein [Planctomycetota bacterium]
MMTTASLFALLLSLPAAFDDKDDLAAAAKKLADAKSYSFKGELTLTVPGRNADNPAPAPTPTAFEGKFADDVGLVVQTAQDEIVKIDGKTAVRPKAVWRVIDDGNRGARGAGGAGGAPGAMAAFAGRGAPGLVARAPREELAGIEGKLDKVTKTDKKENVGEQECSVLEAVFSAEGAKSLAGGGAGRPGGGNNPGAAAEVSATGRFWVTADGRLAKYEITSKTSRSFNNRDFTTSTSRTVTLYDVDKTKVELPAGAKEALSPK